jgi:hypothetical protein
MTITLLTPYNSSETTAAALYLADYLETLGYTVRVVATDRIQREVDPFWDRKITQNTFGATLYNTAYAGAVIQFGLNQRTQQTVKISSSVAERTIRHILVCDEPVPLNVASAYLEAHDRIVCTSQHVFDSLGYALNGNRDKRCITHWDTGERFNSRRSPHINGSIRACFVCDSSVIDKAGTFTLVLIREALKQYAKLYVDVVYTKSWARADSRELRRLRDDYGERIVSTRLNNCREFFKYCVRNDWVVSTAPTGTYILPILTALACGNPVICNRVDPYRFAVTETNGITVPCVEYRSSQSQTAAPVYTNWCDAFATAFTDSRNFLRWCQTHEHRHGLRSLFRDVWEEVLR